MRAASVSHWVLPSFDDEQAFFGDSSLSACASRYLAAGTIDVVVVPSAAVVVMVPSVAVMEVTPVAGLVLVTVPSGAVTVVTPLVSVSVTVPSGAVNDKCSTTGVGIGVG